MNDFIKNKSFFTCLILVIVLLQNIRLFSQEIVRVEGSSQVKLENNMSKDETRRIARELAMINAIENAFGTYVAQDADIMLEDGKVSYNIIGSTRVRGEWVKTTEIKFLDEKREAKGQFGKELEIWITCNIKGKAKPATPKAEIEYLTLNCPETVCRTVEFITGESFYLQFKSPVDGYLCVFLSDDNTVYRLLPYSQMEETCQKAVPVKRDFNYIFFYEGLKYFDNEIVDEYELYTYLKHEFNYVYIVFAEAPYIKPILNSVKDDDDYNEGYKIPASLSFADFEEWLSENRAGMDSFQDRKIKIKISK